jgi:hypothetical protein
MKAHLPTRLLLGAAVVSLLASWPAFGRGFGQKSFAKSRPAQQNRSAQRGDPRATQPAPAFRSQTNSQIAAPQREEHLEQWMDNHKSLSPADQHRALQNEPGFRELPPQLQQRELNQLDRLNTLNPQQRHQELNGVEGLERLSPQQQQQWDHAVQQLHAVPGPRRSYLIHAIADLREMPADQREQKLSSPDFQSQFSPDERQTIRTILTAYPPGRSASEAP